MTTPDPITSLNAEQLSQAIHKQQVSCVEMMQAYLQRIHALNTTIRKE
jgi:Asp-tRNA(Asn)/Glu-tRNA(Gln) amidotransferase A subunit family amidase